MKKVLIFFTVLFFLVVLVTSFWFWWYCLQSTEHTFAEAVVSFVIVVVINIFFDSFLFAIYGLALNIDKASDKIINKLLK